MKVLAVFALALGACAPAPHAGPNVLFVLIDTLRADRLQVYGGRDGLTPGLDRLAEESLVFEQAWSTTSWTLPSMATLLTSNHGAQHGAWLAGVPLGQGIDTLPEIFRAQGYRTAAFTGGGWMRREFGLNRGFEVFEDDVEPIEQATEKVRSYVAAAGDEPWFVLLHTYEVHAPYAPPADVAESLRAAHPEVLTGGSADPLDFQQAVVENGGVVPAAVARGLEAAYNAEVRHADRVLSELVDWLRERGELENTLLIVTSDHGEEFGEHGVLGHSDSLYAEQLRVPWLMRLPGAATVGERDSRPVSQLDFAPTVLEAAGLGGLLPETTFDGTSLLSGSAPSPIYATRNHEEAGLLEAFCDGSWVWIQGAYRWPRAESGSELYDLEGDPAQRENLAGEESASDRALRLRAACERLGTRYGELRAQSESAVDLGGELGENLKDLGYL